MKNKPRAASKLEQPKPKPGETPWTAIVVIGVGVALIAWAASRGRCSRGATSTR